MLRARKLKPDRSTEENLFARRLVSRACINAKRACRKELVDHIVLLLACFAVTVDNLRVKNGSCGYVIRNKGRVRGNV